MLSFSPKQLQAVKSSSSRLLGLIGAVRSGKSFAADWILADMCANAPPGSGCITGKSQGSIKRNLVEELERIFGYQYIKYYPGKQELMAFGRLIHCIGANDERSVGKVKGSTFSFALVDEATEVPEAFFSMLDSRLTPEGARMVFTTNTDSPFHWLKKKFIDRASDVDLEVFNFNLDDNPSLSDNYKNHLKNTYKGLWYKRYILGQWCLAQGAIYDFFDEDVHIIDTPPTYAKYYLAGCDYGTTNPCCFLLLGFNDDVSPCLWVEKEYYFDSKERGYQKTDADYASDLKNFVDGYNVKRIYIDPSAVSFRLEIKRQIPTLQPIEAKNDVLNGIRTVSMHISTGNLKILSSCSNLIAEMQSYVWDEKKTEKGLDQPIKAFDHAADALRYIVHTHFGEKMSLKGKEPLDKEKEWYAAKHKADPHGPWGYGWQKL